jgi:methyl-accepting chemotaxis protein
MHKKIVCGEKEMENRNIWSKIKKWLSGGDEPGEPGAPHLDDDGLMTHDAEDRGGGFRGGASNESAGLILPKGPSAGAAGAAGFAQQFEQYEKMQSSFNKLIDKLQVINGSLELQIKQNRELIERLDTMPELVKSFPAMVENQERIRTQLSEQLAEMATKNEQFLEAVEKIPAEAGRQTDLLEEINEQLGVTAEAEDNMASGFKKFNEILARLNQNTISHTDSIMQMSKTFSTSEKYLKYVISRQNKQFIWLFVVSLSVCVVAIAALTGVILYLAR